MTIEQCRVCTNKDLTHIGTLGDIALSDFTDKPEIGQKFPTDLVHCGECELLQLGIDVPRDLMYKDYWYRSGLNPVIRNDLKEIAELVKGKSVCDIACNDGTFLYHVSNDVEKYGVDPSNVSIDAEKHGTIYHQYWEDFKEPKQFDTITATACLYDLGDPGKFVENMKWHLKEDGQIIAQLMPLDPMVKNNDLGNICHEHIEYYSYKSLVRLFEDNGLEIFKVTTNNINGGSYRLFAKHFEQPSIEFNEIEYSSGDLKDFFARIEENKDKMLKFLANNKVYGYGASTKANTILQYYGITPDLLPAIVDINPKKLGKFTINTGIPIVNKIPDDCENLWVFPYGFLDYFKDKEKDYKGKWVTTIPEFKII